jgi:hypothetical protein
MWNINRKDLKIMFLSFENELQTSPANATVIL